MERRIILINNLNLLSNTVKREIFASSNFRGISRFASIRQKLKSAKYFPIFETISDEDLMAFTIAICGNYLFPCGKTSNMQLSKNSLSLQAI